MKQLTLLRHAKSSWDSIMGNDIDRPLKQRGLDDAILMANLYKQRLSIDLVVSSNAVRALHTAAIFHRIFELKSQQFVLNPSVYHSDIQSLVNIIAETDNTCHSLMLVGHNPAFTYLLNHLTDSYIDNLPTCGIAHIKLNIVSWKEIGAQKHAIEFVDYPSNHRK